VARKYGQYHRNSGPVIIRRRLSIESKESIGSREIGHDKSTTPGVARHGVVATAKKSSFFEHSEA
jgi:hypothetical protein